MTATIRIEDNGPLRIEGEFDLIGPDGNILSEGTWMKIALCRCGLSSKRPFCDGSHKQKIEGKQLSQVSDHHE